jgi:hypothetical protein
MHTLPIAAIGLIIVAMAYFLGRLLYMMIGAIWAVRKATAAANEQLRQELAKLTVEGLRERLLRNTYLSESLRNDASVQGFCARVADGDAVALGQEYSKRGLYKMLVCAELRMGSVGRPEAADNIDEIWTVLQELIRRSALSALKSA